MPWGIIQFHLADRFCRDFDEAERDAVVHHTGKRNPGQMRLGPAFVGQQESRKTARRLYDIRYDFQFVFYQKEHD